jgi:hypothetical protein
MIMYQDKISSKVIQENKNSDGKVTELSIFERNNLPPFTFTPVEMLSGVCYLARDILNKRTEDEVITISKAINSMLFQGNNLIHGLIRNDEKQHSLYSSEGRCLYFLHHYFDLSTLTIQQLSWSEIFAVLALMQCAEVNVSNAKEYGDDELSQALKQHNEFFIFHQQSEIADTIARAEVIIDSQISYKKSGSTGGKAKAEKSHPLKVMVIKQYLAKHTIHDNKRAGAIIEAELLAENNELLNLSKAQDKAIQFATWISQFKNKKLKLPL